MCAVEICPLQSTSSTNASERQMAHLTLDKGKIINTTELHAILGHVGDSILRRTARFYDWNLKGRRFKCEDCGVAKMKQTSVSKAPVARSTVRGERLFIDISSIKHTSLGGSKFWLSVIDDATDMCWSFFLKKKSETSQIIRDFIIDLNKRHGITVKKIRCDNAGENNKLQKDCLHNGLGIEFEYTAPGTPQQNGRVERKFATLYGRARAMMSHAGLKEKQRQLLWCEAVSTATDLENLILN